MNNLIGWMLLALAFGGCFNQGSAQCSPLTALTATDSTQYFTSHPTYGSTHYTNNYDVCWKIQAADASKVIHLSRSSSFELEDGSSSCEYDKLKIYDTPSGSQRTIKFCGTDIFTDLYSSGEEMYLEFTTDSTDTFDGFRLGYKQIDAWYYDASRWSSSYYDYSGSSDDFDPGSYLGMAMGITFGLMAAIAITVVVICVCVGMYAGKRGRVGGVNHVRSSPGQIVVTQQSRMGQTQPQLATASNNFNSRGFTQPQPATALNHFNNTNGFTFSSAQPQWNTTSNSYGVQSTPLSGYGAPPPEYSKVTHPPPAEHSTATNPPPPAYNPNLPPPPPVHY